MTTETRIELPIPAHALPQRIPRELLAMAHRGLEDAAAMRPDGMRYATAHLAALRAAAAVLAARATPKPGVCQEHSRQTSARTLLAMVVPELGEWATFFSDGTSRRAAAEAGVPRVVTAADADDLAARAAEFVALVEMRLGLTR